MSWLRRLFGRDERADAVDAELRDARQSHIQAIKRVDKALDDRRRLDREMARADDAMFGPPRGSR